MSSWFFEFSKKVVDFYLQHDILYKRGSDLMHIENQLKQLILSKYSSLKAFSDYVGISNSTVDSIIKRGVKNANIANVITICRALNRDVDELANGNIVSKNISSPIASREISLISVSYTHLYLTSFMALSSSPVA